jgi:hypothetical protein
MIHDEAIQTIREVLMARAQDVLRDEALAALDSLAENVIMTAGVPETGVVHFIIRFDESGNEYIHNFGTMKWEPLAANSKSLDPEIQTLVQDNFWELAGKPKAVEPRYRFYSKDLDRYFEVEKIYTAGDQFTIRVDGYATTLDGIAQLEAVKPEQECLTCGKQCPNDCPMDKQEPSEDEREFYFRLLSIAPDGDKSVASIASRDRRIRRECEKKYDHIFKWLLGEEGDFPAVKPGRLFGWRGELSERLTAIMGGKE